MSVFIQYDSVMASPMTTRVKTSVNSSDSLMLGGVSPSARADPREEFSGLVALLVLLRAHGLMPDDEVDDLVLLAAVGRGRADRVLVHGAALALLDQRRRVPG
jgi:hypothetical protein